MTESKEIEFIIESDDENKPKPELTTYSYISNGIIFEYFVGYEIIGLLGYKNIGRTINDNVSKSNRIDFRDYPGVKIPELDPRTILISNDGAVEILLKTRKLVTPDVLHILKKFNIDVTNRKVFSKEQQCLLAITNVLKTEKYEDQFKVGRYYIDLYFTEFKIAIEVDENGHCDRRQCDERERMDFINETLEIDDSHWIRFNPDAYDFDISKVIGQIYRRIDQVKQEKYKTQNQLSIKLRQCNFCKIDKPLTTEYFKVHAQGFSKKCIECKDKCGDRNKKEKPLRQYAIDGTFIKEYKSVKEASDNLNIIASQISACCLNKIKTAGKYMWKYIDNDDDEKEEDNDEKEEDNDDEENEKDEYNGEDEDKDNNENIGKMKSLVKKIVAQYNLDGSFIRTFSSGHEAAKVYNVTSSSIYGAIRKKFVSCGYLWRYVENEEIIDKVDEVTPHRKYMKKVDIYKNDGTLYKTYISIKKASDDMKVNISMCRKFLSGIKDDPKGYVWKFKEDVEEKEVEDD